jgi:hypothetical protein
VEGHVLGLCKAFLKKKMTRFDVAVQKWSKKGQNLSLRRVILKLPFLQAL